MFYLNAAFVCMCLSFAVTIGENLPKPKIPSYIDALLCVNEVRPSRDELAKIKDGGLPETKAENCLVNCLWKKANVIVNGKLLVSNAVELIRIQFKVDYERMANVTDRVNLCAIKGKTLTDECKFGGFLYKCILENDGLGTHKKKCNKKKTAIKKMSKINFVINVARPNKLLTLF